MCKDSLWNQSLWELCSKRTSFYFTQNPNLSFTLFYKKPKIPVGFDSVYPVNFHWDPSGLS